MLTLSAAGADALRERIEAALDARPSRSWRSPRVHGFCARLLRDEALEAGVDPFAAPVTPADRLAMLLERIDELPLRLARPARQPERAARLGRRAASTGSRTSSSRPRTTRRGPRRSAPTTRATREREFAALYAAHDRMLAEAGTLDVGDLRAARLPAPARRPHVRARVGGALPPRARRRGPGPSFAQGLLLRLLAGEHGEVTAAGDDDQAIHRFRGAATKNLRDFAGRVARGDGRARSRTRYRCPRARSSPRRARSSRRRRTGSTRRSPARDGGEVAFWRCANERAQAQAVAADVERLVAREGVAPEDIACSCARSRTRARRSRSRSRSARCRTALAGAAAFFQRAEVRDVLAWLRLLVDPGDAGAVVRALARPPIELRSIDLARCTQIARRRKLDMVGALGAAIESPQIPPEARERILDVPQALPRGRGGAGLRRGPTSSSTA